MLTPQPLKPRDRRSLYPQEHPTYGFIGPTLLAVVLVIFLTAVVGTLAAFGFFRAH